MNNFLNFYNKHISTIVIWLLRRFNSDWWLIGQQEQAKKERREDGNKLQATSNRQASQERDERVKGR
jgi:hypothetical protein